MANFLGAESLFDDMLVRVTVLLVDPAQVTVNMFAHMMTVRFVSRTTHSSDVRRDSCSRVARASSVAQNGSADVRRRYDRAPPSPNLKKVKLSKFIF